MGRFYHGLATLLSMKSRSGGHCWSWTAIAMLCLCWPAAHAQQQIPQPGQPPAHLSPGQAPIASEENDPMLARMLALQAAKRNVERQQQLVADTDKLLLLAQQLKKDVDKTDKDTLSVAVIKKAEQIEKLAKSVKDKMKAQQ